MFFWTHGEEELQEFMEYLNKCHEQIKFTFEVSKESINFLDIAIHLNEDGSIWTALYRKPTDSHDYLHYKSAHPHHCKKSLPYSQFSRVRQICMNRADFLRHSLIFFGHFKRRGYPDKYLVEALIKTCALSRDSLLVPSRKETDDENEDLFLITEFCPEFEGLKPLVQKS